MNNEQAHLEEPVSLPEQQQLGARGQGPGARSKASVGSSKKELLHQKLGASCFLPQGLSPSPRRCLLRAPLLFSAMSTDQWGDVGSVPDPVTRPVPAWD